MRALASAAAVIAGAALIASGCGDDPADSDEEQITAVLNQLFDAQQTGDAETACSEVYVIQEPPRPGGEEAAGTEEGDVEGEADAEGKGEAGEEVSSQCEAAFERAAARRRSEISHLSTEVGEIDVEGDRATAIVHTNVTRRDGSELSQDAPYDLVRTSDGWRIRISEEG